MCKVAVFRGFDLKLLVFLSALGAGGMIGVRCSADLGLALTPIMEGAPSVPVGSAAPTPETEIRADDARRIPGGRRPPGIRRCRASPQIPRRTITGRAPSSSTTR